MYHKRNGVLKMKMSELTEKLISNMKEYENKDVVIAKNLLMKNNEKFIFTPVDFEIFYDNRNDKIVLIEKDDMFRIK